MQSPTGTNQQNWSFVVVSDADKRAAIADFYRRAGEMMTGSGYPPPLPEGDSRIPATERVTNSAAYLAECLQEVPIFVIPCVQGRVEKVPMIVAQASTYGSILPAAWSFMLAARARGLGSAWTTSHLFFHDESERTAGNPAGLDPSGAAPRRLLHRRRLQAGPSTSGRGPDLLGHVGIHDQQSLVAKPCGQSVCQKACRVPIGTLSESMSAGRQGGVQHQRDGEPARPRRVGVDQNCFPSSEMTSGCGGDAECSAEGAGDRAPSGGSERRRRPGSYCR